ncbi:MAG: SpoIID/LytB domain-containing protein, partial [Clostridiales bacterium]|nr:SpoIID/LytB domain-containing protein [Clostridiales bacterium]
IKPEIIQGKVLVSGENEIEIEGYGMLPLHEDYRIYKVYGNLAMEKTNNILVGYSVTDFVVSEGKVCAALIKEKVIADNIRVLINTTGYQSLYHKSVTFTSEDAFIINDGKHKVEFPAGEEVTVSAGCKLLQNGRIKVESTAEEGKIALTSISRNYGIPKYRGSIEIAETEKGLTVVNELSIEEYLYSVVPSEMPTSYGSEALKVQAVCARSYAFKQLMANKYSAYGAHVDDSVNCQVYNNVEENEESILSVKDTYGQVLTADGNVITAYYFSTSCGTTANVEDVWEDSAASSYLTGTLQTEEKIHVDLSGEQQFRDFISQDLVNVTVGNKSTLKKMDTFDSGFLMYRWNVTFDIETLSKQINKLLASQYNTSTSSILTYVGKATDEEVAVADYKNRRIVNDLVFANKPIKSIGTVREIYVTQRGSSGIVKELIVIGTEKTILLRYQGNIRSFFAPKDAEVTRLDGSVIRGMSLLPSAFCIFDPIMNDGKLSAYRITGGGFGHGVGMSQNGVKTMTKLGMTYEQILSHYYTDSSITVIYDK